MENFDFSELVYDHEDYPVKTKQIFEKINFPGVKAINIDQNMNAEECGN